MGPSCNCVWYFSCSQQGKNMDLHFRDFALQKKETQANASTSFSEDIYSITFFSFSKKHVNKLCSGLFNLCSQLGLYSEGPHILGLCSAVTVLKFWIIFEQGASCFHFGLIPTNDGAWPGVNQHIRTPNTVSQNTSFLMERGKKNNSKRWKIIQVFVMSWVLCWASCVIVSFFNNPVGGMMVSIFFSR